MFRQSKNARRPHKISLYSVVKVLVYHILLQRYFTTRAKSAFRYAASGKPTG